MKKILITLVSLITSLNVSAQFQDTACRGLGVDHALYSLGHDYSKQYMTLESVGFTIWTVDEGYMPDYTLAQLDSFADEPYYKLLEVLGYGGPYITATNVLTVPVDCIGEGGYSELIDRIARLSDEMSAIESYKETDIDENSRLVQFDVDGQIFEWECELEGKYIDESFIHFFQEIVMNYTNSDEGQLCWFLSMDEEHLVFMWLTPQQMLYMNETLHLHRIEYN